MDSGKIGLPFPTTHMSGTKRRILLISKNFPPTLGGMEQLAWNLYQILCKDYICDVIAPEGAEAHVSSQQSRINTCRISPIPRFLFCAYKNALQMTANENYDLCIGCSGLVAPVVHALRKKRGIPSIILIHGLDIIADNILYQKFFVPRICHSDMIIANSRNTSDLIRDKCKHANITIINPGVERQYIHKNPPYSFREVYHLANIKVLLTVGRIIPRKGVAEFIRNCLPKITASIPDVIFCIAGEQPQNAIHHDRDALKDINDAIRDTQLQKHVLLTGRLDEDMLQSAYAESDLFVFPVLERKNDVEGFGIVSIEAAAHGLPTIAFKSGGIADAIQHQYSGFLVEPGDYATFSETIIQYLSEKEHTLSRENCLEFANRFSWKNYAGKITAVCDQVIRDQDCNPARKN